MSGEITRRKSPEEIELEAKQAELAAIEEEMSSLELDLSTLNSELLVFNASYLNRFGEKFLILDELKSKIAAVFAALSPENKDAVREAQEAAERVRETAEEVREYVQPGYKEESFAPTPELKSLFRAVAKAVHPDLAVDDEDRRRRERFMSEANNAYKAGNVERLQAILDAPEMSRPLDDGEDVGTKLVRLIRMIASAQDRMQAIREEIKSLKTGDAYGLYNDYQEQGDSLFDTISQNLDSKIRELKDTLNGLEEKTAG